MSSYFYVALTANGHKVTGHMMATSPQQLAQQLQAQGYRLVRRSFWNGGSGQRFSPLQLADFFTHLAELETGIPLAQALLILAEMMRGRRWRRTLLSLNDALGQGLLFSQALSYQGFPPLSIQLVQVGEAVGQYGTLFQKLGEHFRWQHNFTQKLRQKLRYPLILGILLGCLIALMGVFVFPQVAEHLQAVGVQTLPPTTLAFLKFVNVTGAYGPIGLSLITLGIGSVWLCHKIGIGRLTMDRLRLYIPAWGRLRRHWLCGQSLTHLGLLLESGVDVLPALHHVQTAQSNQWMAHIFREWYKDVERGYTLSQVCRRIPLMPAWCQQLMALGEYNGRVGPLLTQAGQHLRQQSVQQAENALSLLEPLLLLSMGALLLWVLVATVLPVYDQMGGVF